MPARELIVLGTASQVPTRHRHHNGYVLRWDADAVLFDPGEGSQRQLLLAGVSVHDLTRVCVTHFHGDHALGLPGVIQRIHLDRVPRPVPIHFPAGGREYFDRLRHATAYHEAAEIVPAPIGGGGDGGGESVLAAPPAAPFTLTARRLSHTVETYGYRIAEPDGRRMLPERLAAHGIHGPEVGRLRRLGSLHGVSLAEVSVARPGQRFAFIMDTRLCDAVFALAAGCDLLVIESTFLDAEADLAEAYGHLTAAQAGRVAAECGVRHLVLTHFSQRYQEPAAFAREARGAGFTGELTVAEDLTRIPFPRRRSTFPETERGPGDGP